MVKNPPANAGDTEDLGLTLGSGRFPGVENGNSLQYLAWRIPWTEQPGYSPWGHKEMDMTR